MCGNYYGLDGFLLWSIQHDSLCHVFLTDFTEQNGIAECLVWTSVPIEIPNWSIEDPVLNFILGAKWEILHLQRSSSLSTVAKFRTSDVHDALQRFLIHRNFQETNTFPRTDMEEQANNVLKPVFKIFQTWESKILLLQSKPVWMNVNILLSRVKCGSHCYWI